MGREKIVMYRHYPFDKLRINIAKAIKDENIELKKEAENDNYLIYDYLDKRDVLNKHYLIGQNKLNKKEVFYLGERFKHVCFFKNSLFKCNPGGELGFPEVLIKQYDFDKKVERNYNLRENRGHMVYFNGYGRIHSIDDYYKMETLNDELVIYCHRHKSDDSNCDPKDRFNIDMDFKLKFRQRDNKFVPFFVTDDEEFEYRENYSISDEEIKENVKREKSKRIKNNILDFIDDKLLPVILVVSILAGLVGLIASIITKFDSLPWIIVLIVSIVGVALASLVDYIIIRVIRKR